MPSTIGNFADVAPRAGSDQISSVEGAKTAPIQMSPGSNINEQETPLGPPEAKRARLDTKPIVSTLHPVSELVQKYQGAMFMCTGMTSPVPSLHTRTPGLHLGGGGGEGGDRGINWKWLCSVS